MLTEIVLMGAGGHAKVVYDALRQQHPNARILVVDHDPALIGSLFVDLKVQRPTEDLSGLPQQFHVAIGNNQVRRQAAKKILDLGKRLYSVVHPRAIVSEYAQVGQGVLLAASAIVGPAAQIGDGVILNHAVVIDHDCRVGPFSHIAPNVTLGGGVELGAGVLVGASATILPGIRVGDNSVIGAGALVNRDVPDGLTVLGIPAKPKRA